MSSKWDDDDGFRYYQATQAHSGFIGQEISSGWDSTTTGPAFTSAEDKEFEDIV